MAWQQTAATFLRAFADNLAGPPPAPKAAPVAIPASRGGLPSDIGTALATAAALIAGLRKGDVDFARVESVVNALQQVAVDLGVEPPGVLLAVEGVEWLLPFVHQLYTRGLVTGGYRPLVGGFAGARGHVY